MQKNIAQKSNQQVQKKFIPLGFVLKYDPPIIGLLYKYNQFDKKKKVYNIHLQNLINLEDEVEITQTLFDEHPQFLNIDIIEPEQILGLVYKLKEYRDQNVFYTSADSQLEETESDIIL